MLMESPEDHSKESIRLFVLVAEHVNDENGILIRHCGWPSLLNIVMIPIGKKEGRDGR